MTRSGLLTSAALAAVSFQPAWAKKVDWPQTNHDGARTGFNPKEKTISASNVSSLQMVWTQSIPGDVTSFALGKGMLYFQGGEPSVLTAVDAKTGAIRWSVATGDDTGGNASTVTDGANVYAGCSQPDSAGGTDGAVCAYDAATGAQRWIFCTCNTGYGGDAGVAAPMTYDKGVLYFGYNEPVFTQAPDQYVVAVDAASGSQLWAVDFGSGNGPGSLGNSPVTAGDGNVYVSCVQGSYPNQVAALCAVSEADGAIAWTDTLNGIGQGLDPIGMAVGKKTLYANINGAAAQIAAFDAATGSVKWSVPETGVCCDAPPPATDGSTLYIPFKDPQNNLAQTILALQAKKGKQLWKADANGACSSPSVANGVVYEKNCGGDNTVTVSAFDAATGAFLWNNPDSAGGHYPPPIIANGMLYVANISHQNYNVAAFRLPKGGMPD